MKAKLTVYAVRGTAPAVVTGDEHPISNVVHETFRIARSPDLTTGGEARSLRLPTGRNGGIPRPPAKGVLHPNAPR